MNEVIASINDISKNFPGVKALDKVHFELRSGEVKETTDKFQICFCFQTDSVETCI